MSLTYSRLGTCEQIWGEFKQGFATIIKDERGYTLDKDGIQRTYPANANNNQMWSDMQAKAACDGMVSVLQPITIEVQQFSQETLDFIAQQLAEVAA